MTDQLLEKLYNMGLISSKSSLVKCAQITASAFCRRRLPVVLVRLRMAQNIKEAVTFVEQGHIKVGPNIIKDPTFIVTRVLEDYITWANDSKIREKLLKYNDQLDDYINEHEDGKCQYVNDRNRKCTKKASKELDQKEYCNQHYQIMAEAKLNYYQKTGYGN